MKQILGFSILVCLILTACNFGGEGIRGNGNVKAEQRNISTFDEVEVSGSFDVILIQGELKAVQLEGDENLLPYIEIVQQSDKLEVRTKDGFNLHPSKDIRVYLTAPEFRRIDVSGACDITAQTKISGSHKLELHVSGAGSINMQVDVPEMVCKLSGSGEVNVKGQTKIFELDLSGAANAHCFELLSEETKVHISGAGDADVYASEKLEAEVSGAGTIKYKGDVKNINQQVSGAGSVKKAD